MSIILDLDGTLIDSRKRRYELYKALLPRFKLEFYDFIDLNLSQYERYVLYNGGFYKSFEAFRTIWLNEIEKRDYLAHDTCFPGALQLLETLRTKNELVLFTARQEEENLLRQLTELSLADKFDYIVCTKGEKKSCSKSLALVPKLPKIEFYIGDTDDDFEAAKILGAKFLRITTATECTTINEFKNLFQILDFFNAGK